MQDNEIAGALRERPFPKSIARGSSQKVLKSEHIDDKVVNDQNSLIKLTDFHDHDSCAVDDRERNAWDPPQQHMTSSSQRCRCHARAANNARPSALGRSHAHPASSRPCTEAESAPVRLDARSLTTRFALRIGPVDWNRGEELMFTSTSNADTASAAVEARCP